MLVVDRLAGVLLQVQPLDADAHDLAVDVDLDLALADDRAFVLRYLIALRQVGVEVVLAVEHRDQIDLSLQPKPGAHGLGDAGLVDHGQHAGHRRVDQGDVAVGLAAELRRGARKQLCLGGHLGVHLHADHDLPVAGGAPHEGAAAAFFTVLHTSRPSGAPAMPRPLARPWVGRAGPPGSSGRSLDRPDKFSQYRAGVDAPS